MTNLNHLSYAYSTKKKRVSVIPIQRTAIARRKYKLRGSGGAPQGRPRKEQVLKRQLIIDEDLEDGQLTYKLPMGKKKRRVTKHDLMKSVSEKSKPV